jgi:hypothetical protein
MTAPRLMPLLLAAAAALGACTTERAGPESVVPAVSATQWRAIATRDDRRRLSDWRKAWVKALGQARPKHRAEIAAAGWLLDPDAALPGPGPAAGDYRCRTIKLGARGGGTLDYVAYPPFRCRIEAQADGTLAFVKATGSQRPVGRIFAESSRRMVFLGTLQLGDEQGALRYGHDKARDLAAIVERVGERRWRMAFPYPHYESTIDVVELVPAG